MAVLIACTCLMVLDGCAQTRRNQATRAWFEPFCKTMNDTRQSLGPDRMPKATPDTARGRRALVAWFDQQADTYDHGIGRIGKLRSPPRRGAQRIRSAVLTEYRAARAAYASNARATREHPGDLPLLTRKLRGLAKTINQAGDRRATTVAEIDDETGIDRVRWRAVPCRSVRFT